MEQVTYEQEIVQVLRELNEQARRDVLGFVRTLKNRPPAEPGWKIMQDAREIAFPKEALDEMERAIEESCEIIEDEPDIDLDK